MASLWLALERDLAASTTVLALRQRRWFGCRSGWCRDWLRRLNGHARGRLHSRCWLASAAFTPPHALNARLKLKQMGATCTPGPAAVSVCALAGTHRRKPASHFLVKLIAEMH